RLLCVCVLTRAVCVFVCALSASLFFFFFNDTATTEIYALSLHDALPIFLEEILSFRMQGVEFDNGDMYVDGHKAASDVRDEFVSVTEKLMDELAQCYNVLPQLDINNTIDHIVALCQFIQIGRAVQQECRD